MMTIGQLDKLRALNAAERERREAMTPLERAREIVDKTREGFGLYSGDLYPLIERAIVEAVEEAVEEEREAWKELCEREVERMMGLSADYKLAGDLSASARMSLAAAVVEKLPEKRARAVDPP